MRILYFAACLFAIAGCNRARGQKECTDDSLLALPTDVELYLGSTLSGKGKLEVGRIATCSDLAELEPKFSSLKSALTRAPKRLLPAKVQIHHQIATGTNVAPILGLEVHQDTNSILTATRGSFGEEVWLHEVAHLLVPHTAITQDRTTARLHAAIIEAFGDYYAAALTGTPVDRSKSTPHKPTASTQGLHASHWAALALAPTFEPHQYAAPLSRQLLETKASSTALLEDLRTALTTLSEGESIESPRALVSALVRVCPARSRSSLDASLRAWLPAALLQAPSRLAKEKL